MNLYKNIAFICGTIFIGLTALYIYMLYTMSDGIVHHNSTAIKTVKDYFENETDMAYVFKKDMPLNGAVGIHRCYDSIFLGFENYGVTLEKGMITSYCMFNTYDSESSARDHFTIVKCMMEISSKRLFHELTDDMCIIGKNEKNIEIILNIVQEKTKWKVIMISIP